jgi:hypothetical protein
LLARLFRSSGQLHPQRTVELTGTNAIDATETCYVPNAITVSDPSEATRVFLTGQFRQSRLVSSIRFDASEMRIVSCQLPDTLELALSDAVHIDVVDRSQVLTVTVAGVFEAELQASSSGLSWQLH